MLQGLADRSRGVHGCLSSRERGENEPREPQVADWTRGIHSSPLLVFKKPSQGNCICLALNSNTSNNNNNNDNNDNNNDVFFCVLFLS